MLFASTRADHAPKPLNRLWYLRDAGAAVTEYEAVVQKRAEVARGEGHCPKAFSGCRGGPKTAAFAPAKAAQRSLAESTARSL